MVEPVGTTDPPVATEPAGQPTPLVNADGVLSENWRDSLPEDIRGEKVFDRVSDFEGIMKSLASAERMVGKDKIAIPTTDEEWDVFHKIGGKPDTAADYNFVKPDDFPEEHWSQDFAIAAQDILFKFGASKPFADALLQLNLATTLAGLKAKQDADGVSLKEAENTLYKDWGNAYEQNKHLGNVAIEQAVTGKDGVVNEEFKARLVEKFGNDPDFIRAFSNLGNKFAEHGDIAVPGVPTPTDMQSAIDEEMAHKSYGTDYAKHGFTKAQHKTQVAKVYRMREELIASTKTG